MAGALADAMSKSKVKTLGFIGFADAYGDGWLDVMQKAAKASASRSSRSKSTAAPTPA